MDGEPLYLLSVRPELKSLQNQSHNTRTQPNQMKGQKGNTKRRSRVLANSSESSAMSPKHFRYFRYVLEDDNQSWRTRIVVWKDYEQRQMIDDRQGSTDEDTTIYDKIRRRYDTRYDKYETRTTSRLKSETYTSDQSLLVLGRTYRQTCTTKVEQVVYMQSEKSSENRENSSNSEKDDKIRGECEINELQSRQRKSENSILTMQHSADKVEL